MAEMEMTEFGGWSNCIRLSNGEIELIITTDVGPRIISFGFINGQNLLYVSDEDKGKSGGSQWRLYGGHRLWHAPEEAPRTYFPDNKKVGYKWDGKTLKLTQDIESTTGIIKELEITLDPVRNNVTLLHRIINRNLWTIETSVWPVTAHAAGGMAVVPQEPYIDPAEYLLPARPVVLWYYTQMNDPRWVWGDKYVQLRHDPGHKSEQKAGILNKQGWAAYIRKNDLMIKHFDYHPDSSYTDYGCNNEIYVNGDFLEIETLGPITKLAPGNFTDHTEYWSISVLKNGTLDSGEEQLDRILIPAITNLKSDNR